MDYAQPINLLQNGHRKELISIGKRCAFVVLVSNTTQAETLCVSLLNYKLNYVSPTNYMASTVF
jgi:hypothetical protein